jgi:hypothetical protein
MMRHEIVCTLEALELADNLPQIDDLMDGSLSMQGTDALDD